MNKITGVLLLVLNTSSLLATDVRIAGMGGWNNVVQDVEFEAFYNPALLPNIERSYVIAGIGARFDKGTYGTAHTFMDTTIYTDTNYNYETYNPTLGLLMPVTVKGPYIGIMAGLDINCPDVPNNYGIINLRLAQKLKNFNIGVGYDNNLNAGNSYGNKLKSQVIIGAYFGSKSNNYSVVYNRRYFNRQCRDSETTLTAYNSDNLSFNWFHKWKDCFLTALASSYAYERHDEYQSGYERREHDFGLQPSIQIRIKPINTIASAGINLDLNIYQYKPYFISHYNTAYSNTNLHGWWCCGVETEITPFITIRGGLNAGKDFVPKLYTTVYDQYSSYVFGTTYKINENIKMEYAFIPNFKRIKEDQDHYLKLIYSY
ncbi:MAG: hypothetical protein KJ620_08975 [Candidatus Edwardsbacteria bacterium]|nr:hypothetical protein [Candidatus Edwardsbacteria bacterium]MBU1576885.1 hypothetical protein [Candidatus Edwardsbacteria bacterium]MBU2463687.1 hypothetical protein [Candidatus Edwardsbacteria bacterium]MBU2594246.1 hypothetical protein [Candidatus Edwardsbacteria bacterium]